MMLINIIAYLLDKYFYYFTTFNANLNNAAFCIIRMLQNISVKKKKSNLLTKHAVASSTYQTEIFFANFNFSKPYTTK